MVYGGKPSTGCQTCRQRHIKCDETRPHCRACVRTGRSCPGYPHPLDVMLRDRTAFQRKKRSVSSSKPPQVAKKDQEDPQAQASPTAPTSNMAVMSASSNTTPPSSPPVVVDLPPQVPGTLSLPMEDTVSSLFFNSYLFLPKDPLIRLGYMELLPVFYFNTSFDSPLRLAVQAVSYFSVAAWTGQRSLLRTAEQTFMKAVSRTRLTLQGNIDHHVEETLMTILLLSTFEEFSALKENRVTNKAHLHGAIALVNSRRLEQRKTAHSQTLTMAVQTQIVRTSLGLAYPMAQTPSLSPLPMPLAETASGHLTIVTSEIVSLRQTWDRISSTPGSYQTDELKNLLSTAMALDNKISVWKHILPDRWHPTPATFIPQSVRDAGVFENRCDCYLDLWIASTWNFYRDSRIVIQNIIINCLRLLPEQSSPHEIQARTASIQKLATDICATVPYLLGDQTMSVQMSPHKVEYPECEGRRVTPGHQQTAPLLGGWFVISYLTNLWSPELCLREEQRAWIRKQMLRVLRIYTFHTLRPWTTENFSWSP
ncbi:C6 zinc finger domain protein [Aspergillus steynii IBT 23096]|uniref:C6 zinc finger domain protein n=1 Tax=Aspergillus steynii IBT 23096 TaxID=1392250 RepID=A0A2I2GI73_9EURO|nr:C6 zinc finger domain protein [Aspergillus steynii IBT 23096]PLB52580.1 C6 zinc finger domain protein [Aspergillus steynii IBT 23096]